MTYSKLQKITFYTFAKEYGLDNIYLDKYLDQLKNNTPMPERNYIKELVKQVELSNIFKFEEAVLLFCLHTEKPKNGFVDMLIKELIKETGIHFSEEVITLSNQQLNIILAELNLPPLPLDKNLIARIAQYSEEFKKTHRSIIE